METRWLYTTSENFTALREASKDTCILPIGCVEKHGLHLPLGTDIFVPSHLAYLASQLETVCVAPDFVFGDMPYRGKNLTPGTISLPFETELLLLEQLCEEFARNGFKKIILLNGHGGNADMLYTFIRKVENSPHDYEPVMMGVKSNVIKGIAAILKEQGSGAIPELNADDEALILKYFEEGFKDNHATFSETAYVMGYAPESVHMERLGIESGKSRDLTKKYKEHGIYIRDGGWEFNFPNSYQGDDPYGVNERIAKAGLRLEAERLAKGTKFLKEDEDLIKWHNERWEKQI
jgi:creatinine amidohydrolase